MCAPPPRPRYCSLQVCGFFLTLTDVLPKFFHSTLFGEDPYDHFFDFFIRQITSVSTSPYLQGIFLVPSSEKYSLDFLCLLQ